MALKGVNFISGLMSISRLSFGLELISPNQANTELPTKPPNLSRPQSDGRHRRRIPIRCMARRSSSEDWPRRGRRPTTLGQLKQRRKGTKKEAPFLSCLPSPTDRVTGRRILEVVAKSRLLKPTPPPPLLSAISDRSVAIANGTGRNNRVRVLLLRGHLGIF